MELKFFKRSKTAWTPANYAVDETSQMWNVAAGDLVGPLFGLVRVAFDGTGGRTVAIGDGNDIDRFMSTSIGDVSQVAGTYLVAVGGAVSNNYVLIGRHLYTAADTIDITFVAATGGSPTVGSVDFWSFIAKVWPH